MLSFSEAEIMIVYESQKATKNTHHLCVQRERK